MSNVSEKKLLTEREVQARYGFPTNSLQKWRRQKRGPRAIKVFSSVYYDPADIESWIKAQPTIGGCA